MRVCLLNDSFPPVIDGVANTVMNYARVLTSLGDTVAVATPRYPGASYDQYPYEVIPYQSIDTSKLVHGYRAGNPFDPGAIAKMKAVQPDLIHTHCPVASCVMARILRNETEAPVVFTYHTKFDYDIARMVKAKPLQQGSIAFLVDNISACDEVWTVSKGAGENLKSLGFKGEYRVMQNGVDFPKGRVSAEEVQQIVGGYDLPGEVPCYLFVGRLMAYKGLPIIVDAMRKLSEKGLDYRCVFVGGGADAEAMQQRAIEAGLAVDVYAGDDAAGNTDETAGDNAGNGKGLAGSGSDAERNKNRDTLGNSNGGAERGSAFLQPSRLLRRTTGSLPGRLIFTGAIHDRLALRAWNTRADLFLFPSTYDTNGIVVREAAACGLASVLIRNSCAAEGITDGHNGYFIDENADSMAALLEQLHGKREEVRTAGQNAMDEIYISWDDAVRVARKRYAEILDLSAADELPIRHWEPSDTFLEMAEQFAGDGEPMFRTSRIREEGMLGNYYNARSRLTRSAAHPVQAMKEGTRNLSSAAHGAADHLESAAHGAVGDLENAAHGTARNMENAAHSLENRLKKAADAAREFLDDGHSRPGQGSN